MLLKLLMAPEIRSSPTLHNDITPLSSALTGYTTGVVEIAADIKRAAPKAAIAIRRANHVSIDAISACFSKSGTDFLICPVIVRYLIKIDIDIAGAGQLTQDVFVVQPRKNA